MAKIFRFLLIFILIFSWIFSGWPQIWHNPPIPPVIKETRAASPEAFAADGTFTASTGIYAVTVECWGGGGGGGELNNSGGGGGGGGAYAKSTNVAVVPGTGYAVDVGAGGAARTAGADSTFNGTTVVAKGGGGGTVATTPGTGGSAAASTGNAVKSDGGTGGTGDGTADSGGGGGGAGGPNGAGTIGQNGNYGSSGYGGAGGNGNAGVGTGTGGTGVSGANGNPGGSDLSNGGGGGGGGDDGFYGGQGGTPGGGGGGGGDNEADGGPGADGRCIVSYTDIWAPSVSQTSYDNAWTFSTAPNNDAGGQISMVATTGYDYNTISYSFTFTACASNGGTGGTSSGWQAGASYSDIGLDPNKCYGYTVQTKDSLENTGTASASSETYSSANTPGQPTLGSATATTLTLTNAENSNPSANPVTEFAVYVNSTSPSDTNWLGKWVNASGEPSTSEVWITDANLDGLVIGSGGTPLANSTQYGFQVKAKNYNGDPTVLGTEGFGTTTALSNTAPSISSVALNGGLQINLIEGSSTSTSVAASGTDAQGGDTVTSATATIYRSGQGNNCVLDDNDCYPIASGGCSFGTPSGNNWSVTCAVGIWYIAEPAANWMAMVQVTDTGSLSTASSTASVTLNTLLALNVTSSFQYNNGSEMTPGANTGASNATTTITNTGNADMDPQLAGQQMSCSSGACAGQTISVGNQKYSSSPFVYSGGGTALSGTPTTLNLTLPKPTATTTAITDDISWGLGVPEGLKPGTFQGTVSSTATGGI